MSVSTAELIRMRLLKRTVNYFTKCVILLNVVGSQEELVTPSEIHSFIGYLLLVTIFVIMRFTKISGHVGYPQRDDLFTIINYFLRKEINRS